MSAGIARLNRFFEAWRGPLERQAGVLFEARLHGESSFGDTTIADRLVESMGLQPIGFNWEMLDASQNDNVPRSAIAAFSDALAKNMVCPSQEWLGVDCAKQCGSECIDSFKPATRTILTNRLDMGWNPISAATIEWAFVGFDERKIALLLVTAEE